MAGPYGNFFAANEKGANSDFFDDSEDTIGTSFSTLNKHEVDYNARQQGVFALHPLATPKYAKNEGLRDGEFRDTLARIYISLADAAPATQANYLASLPGDQATQSLAKVLLGSNTHGGTGFVDFFLTSVQEQFQEIVQIDKVLSDDYVAFFFGQQPPQFQYSGVLLNSMQDDQRSGFAKAYLQMLRGTQLARRGALARLRYDSVIVSGTMVTSTQALNAENEMAVPFTFTFLVKEYVVLNNPKFVRREVSQYVKLAADANVAALAPVGTVTDTRIRTVAVTPETPATSSSVETPTTVLGAVTAPLQQFVARALQVNAGPPEASNIRGTVDPTPPTPPQIGQ